MVLGNVGVWVLCRYAEELVWTVMITLRCFDGEMLFSLRWKILYRYVFEHWIPTSEMLLEKKT